MTDTTDDKCHETDAMMDTSAPLSAPAEIATAICSVKAEVGSIEKRGRNEFHRYDYATAADLAHKLQPLMAKHGLVVVQNEVAHRLLADGAVMAVEYEFALAHKSGAVWPEKPKFTGVAAAKNTKGGFDDKCVNKCHTAARKYFLLGLFQIPTGDYDDADAQEDRPEVKSAPAPKAKAQEIAPPPSKEEVATMTAWADDRHKAGMLRDALRAATDAEMVTGVWEANADFVATLPQATQAFLVGVRNEVLDKLAPEDTEEPEAARYLRAG